MRILIFALLVFASFGQVPRTPPKRVEFKPGAPVEQPLPYSHKTHVGLGLQCGGCHAIAAPGDYAGYPKETFCMSCHATMKKESPHIQALAAAAKEGRRIAWKRVYKVKEFVYFSHDVHVRRGKTECGACHGEVGAREVLFQEKPVDMYSCMQCHEERKAPNNCEVCHDTH